MGTTSKGDLSMLTLTISGMTCDHCVRAVTEALEKVPGVTAVTEVSLEKGVAVVEGTPDLFAVGQALREEGYESHAIA